MDKIHFGVQCLDGPSVASADSASLLFFGEPGPLRDAVGEAELQRWRTLCRAIGIDDRPPPAAGGSGMELVAETMERVLAQLHARPPKAVRPFDLASKAFLTSPAAQPTAEAAARLALRVVSAARAEVAAPDILKRLRDEIVSLRHNATRRDPALGMDAVTALMMDAAREKSVPCRHSRLHPATLVLGEGRRQIRFDRTLPLRTPVFGTSLTADKIMTKRFLAGLGLPVLPCHVVTSAAEVAQATAALGYPVVIKPVDASESRGVTLDVRTADEATAAYARAEPEGSAVIVEPYLDTPDYRATLIGGRVSIVMCRNRPFVVGDGRRSIAQLLDAHNADVGSDRALFPAGCPVTLDEEVERTLQRGGRSLETVPAPSEKVFVRTTPVRVRGGYPVDVTASTHSDIVLLMEHLARLLPMTILAVDFRAEAIERSWRDQRFAILEANCRPSITDIDEKRLARELVDVCFPDPAAVRMPTLLVVSGEAAADAEHLVPLFSRRPTLGHATSAGVFVGPCRAMSEPPALSIAHDRLAEAPIIDIAVHWTHPDRIGARGLGVARIDHAFLPERAGNERDASVHDLVRRHADRVHRLPTGDATARAAPVLAAIDRLLRDRVETRAGGI